MSSISKVLIIGNSVRNIACSARKAGYIIYAIDRFGDVDLRKCAGKTHVIGDIHEKELKELVESFNDVDAVILGPGFENLKLGETLNNSIETVNEAGDKSKIPEVLKSLDIPHPETEPLDKAEGMDFPLMIKPISGSGGMRNIIVRTKDEMDTFLSINKPEEFIAQEFIDGISCSASLICNRDAAAVISLNEQLIGLSWLTRLPFTYCGNITPFHTIFEKQMVQYAEQIAVEYKLAGSNGVDFIINEKGATVIEINPRFQGSLDAVELSTGINIFDAHIKSFDGILPGQYTYRCFAAKCIVFADQELMIDRNLSEMLEKYMVRGEAVDIPESGTAIGPDEPITTILATAPTRRKVLDKAKRYSQNIRSRISAQEKRILYLKKALERAYKIDEKKLAEEIKKIGFKCKKCAQCCKAEYGDNTVIVFPSEIREIGRMTGLSIHDFVAPAPSKDTDSKGNIHTFEWILKKNKDCIFLENDNCRIYQSRPYICATYPFYIMDGKLEVSDCTGIGGKTTDMDSFILAEHLKKRYIMEIIEAISLLSKFNGFIPGTNAGICVHDGEGEHWLAPVQCREHHGAI